MRLWSFTTVVVLLVSASYAQSPTPGGMPPPPGMGLAQAAAMRFPQPVRVGNLVGRPVLQPIEAQSVLGRVNAIVRDDAGSLLVDIELRQWFGLNSRRVAVPVDAMVLVGEIVEIAAFTPAQLWSLPIFDPSGRTKLSNETLIRVGLAKPSH